MDLSDIENLYSLSPKLGALSKLVGDKAVKDIYVQGLAASSAPVVFDALTEKAPFTALFILPDADTAGYFYQDLSQISGQENIFFFPSSYKRAVKYGQKDSANLILRTEVITRLNEEYAAGDDILPHSFLYIVSYPEAVAELVVSKKQVKEKVINIKTGQRVDITDLTKQLRSLGFSEVDYVYEPGQFAVRGSIVDIYSYSSEYPFRIDFFGDDVDTIRTFDVGDQLSKEKCSDINIIPELSSDVLSDKTPFFEFFPNDSFMVMTDFTYVKDTIAKIYDDGFSKQALAEQLENATEIQRHDIQEEMKRENVLVSVSQFLNDSKRFRHIIFGKNIDRKADDKKVSDNNLQQYTISFSISPQPLFHKNFDLLKRTMTDFIEQDYKLYILADSKKQLQRLNEIISETSSDRERSSINSQRSELSFTPVDRTLHEGFIDNELKLCFFTDHQIFDRFHKYSLKSNNARLGKMALTMKALREMNIGDYIVHVDFGIGKFGGLVRVPSGNGWQEVIRIIYKNNDIVDVSIHSLYKISKYRSGDAERPVQLSILGTGAWNRLKERTKKHIKDIARDLIKLYAKRRHEKGFAFSNDDYMQHELEASFVYEDTPDQLKTTQDVKSDMESQRPMDRLVCGDVGFGKTEVAVRAAFKAACDSKQTAVLVPTTVLAFQHFQTFRDRLKNFPVRVEYLSRARTAKQTKQVIDDLSAGRIDILIGTHKLIGSNVRWHDLGLLIIDEEQKFGVTVKEKLRKLKSNVDTLTLSATPIPRTLQFSLMGARDMSIIRTPPPNRYPIQTELSTFNRDIIVDAINFEMSRNGQAFFVNNRISQLPEIADMIKKNIPDCRVVIGHGQMKPEELEKIVMEFVNYDYDVLISTTIVENGIDIPNANTIIINDAQRFGLSDLHQMRGRVGRSNRKAFCYLLAPPKSALVPEARRRLEAIETFSDLGSGFNLAMQDLDIRGAGNLLGAAQSGFIEDLGYETYQKILTQAVTELKNDEFSDLYADDIIQGKEISGDEFVEDCSVDSDLEMFFGEDYVPGSSERILLYRELDNITDDASLDKFRKRMIDRFGPMPSEGEELLQVVPLRRIGRSIGCEKIILRSGAMSLQFVSNDDSAYYRSSAFEHVLNYIAANPRQCKLKDVSGRHLLNVLNVNSVEKAVRIVRQMQ